MPSGLFPRPSASPTARPYAYFGLRPISSRQAREPSRTRQAGRNRKILKICGFFNRTNFGEVRSKRDKRASETDFRPVAGLGGSVALANSFEILKEMQAIFSPRTSSRRKAGGGGATGYKRSLRGASTGVRATAVKMPCRQRRLVSRHPACQWTSPQFDRTPGATVRA